MKKEKIIGISGNLGSGKDTVADYIIQQHDYVRIALADPLKRLGSTVFGFTYQQLWGDSGSRNAHDGRYYAGSAMWKTAAKNLQAFADQWLVPVCAVHPNNANPLAIKASLFVWFEVLESSHPDLSPRIMLQSLGTEWGREAVDENVWINILLDTAEQLLHRRWDGTTTGTSKPALKYTPEYGLKETSKPDAIHGVVVSDVRFQNEFEAIRSRNGTLVKVLREATDGAAQSIGIPQHASETQDFPIDKFDFIIRNDSSLSQLYNSIDLFMKVL